MYKITLFCYSWTKNITEVLGGVTLLIISEQKNKKQADKNYATCKEKKKADILVSFPLL